MIRRAPAPVHPVTRLVRVADRIIWGGVAALSLLSSLALAGATIVEVIL